MARPSSTIDRLFARLEAAATGRGGDRDFVRRHVTGMGRIVTGAGVHDLAERVGARAFTTDRGTIAMPELRTHDPENLALLFHEYFHQRDGHAHGGEVEERQAQAQEALVYHLAHDEGVTDVGEILGRLEHEREAWMASADTQPGGTLEGVRAARADREVRREQRYTRRAARRTRRRNRRGERRHGLSPEDAIEILFEAGFDVHGIVEALVERWGRLSVEERREHAFRFAGRTVT